MDAAHIRPLVKHSSIIRSADGAVYVDNSGVTHEIADPDGAVQRLLSLLDGTRTVHEVHRDLVAHHPNVTIAEVEAAIAAFDEARFLLDATQTPDGLLDEYELSRWERNINFFGAYARLSDNKHLPQRRLADCRVTLLGVGGLGSHLLLDMAALGVGHIRIVEFDRVELSNLNRQILYSEADVGRPKLQRAAERVRQFNSHLDLETMDRRLSSAADVMEAAEGADILISTADRPKTEIMSWVNEAIVRHDIPLITGGLDTRRCVYYSIIPGQTGCIECWRQQVHRQDPVADGLLNHRRANQISGDKAAFVPLVAMTTALILGELVRLVTGLAPPLAAGRLMHARFDDYEFGVAESWERLPDCPVCGSLPARELTSVVASPAHR
jgi:molybdopterin/thiamine biosynthesis adenylyltransferase